MRWGLRGLLGPVFALCGAAGAHAAGCGGLQGLKLDSARVVAASEVAGDMAKGLPAHCKVAGVAGRAIRFQVWLPAQGWNGRLLSVGNGGFAGTIPAAALADGLAKGYAVTGNDTGHQGEARAWMQERELVREWGHSATHLVTAPAKAIVRAYYGTPASFSYFAGCSTGGAQAMEEAEFYPGDYDGVVAGAPGMSYARLMLSFLWGLKATEAPGAALSPAKLRLLHAAVLQACDGADGLKDGLIGDPLACRFDPASLACRDKDEADCLTAAEVHTAQLIYQGPRNPRTGAQIYPGFAFGSEADASTTADNPFAYGWGGIQGPLARMFAIPLLRDMVYRDPAWDWRSFDWDKDVAALDRRIARDITATRPDLRAFARRGKLIMYQGWGDPLNAQTLPIDYRDEVIGVFARTASRAHAEAQVDGFFRLFMAPGMAHCGGGPGPNRFDALPALRDWVEQGRAPERMVATGGTLLPAGASLPLCPFPARAVYDGREGAIRAESFQCRLPDRP